MTNWNFNETETPHYSTETDIMDCDGIKGKKNEAFRQISGARKEKTIDKRKKSKVFFLPSFILFLFFLTHGCCRVFIDGPLPLHPFSLYFISKNGNSATATRKDRRHWSVGVFFLLFFLLFPLETDRVSIGFRCVVSGFPLKEDNLFFFCNSVWLVPTSVPSFTDFSNAVRVFNLIPNILPSFT